MNLKRYRVNNIKEALKFIKRDLGPDALIVSTRQVKEGKGAFAIILKDVWCATSTLQVVGGAACPPRRRRPPPANRG